MMMATEFTITVSAVIAGEMYFFERKLPLSNDMARKLAGAEISMVLDEFNNVLKSSNLILKENTKENE